MVTKDVCKGSAPSFARLLFADNRPATPQATLQDPAQWKHRQTSLGPTGRRCETGAAEQKDTFVPNAQRAWRVSKLGLVWSVSQQGRPTLACEPRQSGSQLVLTEELATCTRKQRSLTLCGGMFRRAAALNWINGRHHPAPCKHINKNGAVVLRSVSYRSDVCGAKDEGRETSGPRF